MRNQFVYTEKVEIPAVAENKEEGIVGKDAYVLEKKCSLNVNLIIRSITLDDGKLLILLNDIHERVENVRKVNPKNGKVSLVKEKNAFQSEIYLSKEDAERFFNQLNIEV